MSVCEDSIEKAVEILLDTYRCGAKILLCGNGGSCADCDHIVGELMKGFMLRRKVSDVTYRKLEDNFPEEAKWLADNLQEGIPAISLSAHSAVFTAFANDVEPDMVYAQMAYAYGRAGDTVIGISTSGNSKNVVNAMRVAKSIGLKTIGLVGEKKCLLDDICDVTIKVPQTETYKVQEYHLPVYHYICSEIEKTLFEA